MDSWKKLNKKEFWGQAVEESPSGRTWRININRAFWDKTVGVNARIVHKAVKLFGRRLEILVGNPAVSFTIPAWKIRLEGKEYYRDSKFNGSPPLKFYMIPIPREKLEELH